MDYEPRDGAWVHPDAQIDPTARLGLGALIGPRVVIGPGCRIHAGATIISDTVLGPDNAVHAGAVLGGDPQDVGYAGERSSLVVGARNTFREMVTISRGSPKTAERTTRIGDDNYFMAGAHLGHDVTVEDRCILANNVLIGGHCHIHSGANLSGASAVVQFTTIGRFAFVGGLVGCRQDLEPFILHDRGSDVGPRPMRVNVVGLRRGGISEESIAEIRAAFKRLYRQGAVLRDAVAELRAGPCGPEVTELLDFIERKLDGHFGRQLVERRPRPGVAEAPEDEE